MVPPDVIRTDKVVKAEHKFREEMEEHLGPELLREGLQEHWVTEVKEAFGKQHQAVAVAAAFTVVAVAVTMVAVRVPMAAVAVAQDHPLYPQEARV
jgi:hypothetical protein